MASSFVGQSVPRVDGTAKVRGTASYVDDRLVPGALWGGTVRSAVARGRLVGVRRDPSFDWTGVTVVTHEDVPVNVVAGVTDDQPLLAAAEVRHCYEPVALVACDDPARLRAALRAITPLIEPEAPVLDLETALAARADADQILHGTDNVQARHLIEHELGSGSIEERLAACEVVVRGRYRVPPQEHLYLEPQGMIAWWSTAGVHITGSLESLYGVHAIVRRAFQLEADRVHVAQATTGGGFGGKTEYPGILAAHAALLARASRRPVRMVYGRREDMEATPKRHPARIDIAAGCTRDGDLVALDVRVVMDGGAYVTITPAVLARAVAHAAGAYRWRHARLEGIAVATNRPPSGAARGFGAPQTLWAIERHMDRLAEALGKEPLSFKRGAALAVGSVTTGGQRLVESVGVDECIGRVLEASKYGEKRAAYDAAPRDGRVRRGIGGSVFLHGDGGGPHGELSFEPPRGEAVRVDLETGGRLRVRTSATDTGQGTETVLRQIAADAAEIPLASVEVETPSTSGVPDSGPPTGSRAVMEVGAMVESGAKAIADRVRVLARARGAAAHDEAAWAAAADAFLMHEGRAVSERVTPARPPGEVVDASVRGVAHPPYPVYSWGCHVAEVEVDLDTFETRVLGFWAAADVGKAIHPVMCAGQVEGAVVEAIGWALCERVAWNEGTMLNADTTDYVTPTSKDAPPLHTFLIEHPFSGGPSGAKGAGEIAMNGGAPAIAAAVEQAIGVACNDLPLLPEALLEAHRANQGNQGHQARGRER